jgi:hypothetical protein
LVSRSILSDSLRRAPGGRAAGRDTLANCDESSRLSIPRFSYLQIKSSLFRASVLDQLELAILNQPDARGIVLKLPAARLQWCGLLYF